MFSYLFKDSVVSSSFGNKNLGMDNPVITSIFLYLFRFLVASSALDGLTSIVYILYLLFNEFAIIDVVPNPRYVPVSIILLNFCSFTILETDNLKSPPSTLIPLLTIFIIITSYFS